MNVVESKNEWCGCASKQADALDELVSDFSWKTWIKFSDTRHTECRTSFQKQLKGCVNPCSATVIPCVVFSWFPWNLFFEVVKQIWNQIDCVWRPMLHHRKPDTTGSRIYVLDPEKSQDKFFPASLLFFGHYEIEIFHKLRITKNSKSGEFAHSEGKSSCFGLSCQPEFLRFFQFTFFTFRRNHSVQMEGMTLNHFIFLNCPKSVRKLEIRYLFGSQAPDFIKSFTWVSWD